MISRSSFEGKNYDAPLAEQQAQLVHDYDQQILNAVSQPPFGNYLEALRDFPIQSLIDEAEGMDPGSVPATRGLGREAGLKTPSHISVKGEPVSAPMSPDGKFSDFPDEDEFEDVGASSEEAASEQDFDLVLERTAAERLAEKRRMKRFRLTRNQTRFLMSEFVRQPHPDAAQRYRLAKEIPGLTPRRVQVWFQNRRAKAKRLTSEGGMEGIVRSRTLPEGLNLSHVFDPSLLQGHYSRPARGLIPPEAMAAAYADQEHSESDSIPSGAAFFPSATPGTVAPDPFYHISPASEPTYAANYESPNRFLRPQTSAGLVRPQRLTRRQTEGLGAFHGQPSPIVTYIGNIEYAQFGSGIEVAAAQQRASSASLAEADAHQLEHTPILPFSPRRDAFPPTPESAVASMMTGSSTSLPSTLLSFSRMYDQNAFRGPNLDGNSRPREAHPMPAATRLEAFTSRHLPTAPYVSSESAESRQFSVSPSNATYSVPYTPAASSMFYIPDHSSLPPASYTPKSMPHTNEFLPRTGRYGRLAGHRNAPPSISLRIPEMGGAHFPPQVGDLTQASASLSPQPRQQVYSHPSPLHSQQLELQKPQPEPPQLPQLPFYATPPLPKEQVQQPEISAQPVIFSEPIHQYPHFALEQESSSMLTSRGIKHRRGEDEYGDEHDPNERTGSGTGPARPKRADTMPSPWSWRGA